MFGALAVLVQEQTATRRRDRATSVQLSLRVWSRHSSRLGSTRRASEKDSVTGGYVRAGRLDAPGSGYTWLLFVSKPSASPHMSCGEVVQTLRRNDTNPAVQERVQYGVVIFAGYVSLFSARN